MNHGRVAHVYVRPHEIDVHQTPVPESFAVVVQRVIAVGAHVRLELAVPLLEAPLSVEIALDRSEAPSLHAGDQVYVAPRRLRVFAGDDATDSLTASSL